VSLCYHDETKIIKGYWQEKATVEYLDTTKEAIDDLLGALLLLENKKEALRFMKDLCTPQEIAALAERWRVCRLLYQGEASYREINEMTGASLATITRVARFLKNESYQGYKLILDREQKKRP
jgi:TrpR-related protein YerC/YecD